MKQIVLNRVKSALADAQKSNKWLAEQLDKDDSTISRWCRNVQQPDLETLFEVSVLLGVDIGRLLVSTEEFIKQKQTA